MTTARSSLPHLNRRPRRSSPYPIAKLLALAALTFLPFNDALSKPSQPLVDSEHSEKPSSPMLHGGVTQSELIDNLEEQASKSVSSTASHHP